MDTRRMEVSSTKGKGKSKPIFAHIRTRAAGVERLHDHQHVQAFANVSRGRPSKT